MNWTDKASYIEIYPPKEFSFEECLVFLGRSDQEVLYKIEDGSIIKLIKIDESLVLCRIGYIDDSIRVDFLTEAPSEYSRREIAGYVWEWFDLNQDGKAGRRMRPFIFGGPCTIKVKRLRRKKYD